MMDNNCFPNSKDAFISYSSRDFDEVNNLKSVLEANGISCWMAPQSMPGGSSYAVEIPAAIKNCHVFLLMISSKSLDSQWVPKELSIALGMKKTVLPLMLEDCALTDSFKFFLTDVQRYNAYESKTEILKLLISRIEQIRISNESSGEPSNHIISSKINSVESWIVKHNRNEIDRSFTAISTLLRKKYSENPNAVFIQQWLTQQAIDGNNIIELFNSLYMLGVHLFSVAEFSIQVALIYIHSGEKNLIRQAREYLNRAVHIYSNASRYNVDCFKRIVYAKWLLAVTYKQERNFGYANDICEDLIYYINTENKIFGVPYADSLLLPQRELAVINKERLMCDYLVSHMDDIQYNTTQYFFTLRRLFELYILNNDFAKAKDIIPEMLDSYRKCEKQVDAIYRVGLYQNLFEYYSYIGNKERASYYYRLALSNARKNFWKGKEQKLEDLKDIFKS